MRRKGEGSITPRKRAGGTVSYMLKYEGRRGANGERQVHYRTAKGSTMREAQRELREFLKSLDDNTHVDDASASVSDWVTTWLQHLATNEVGANKTRERYGQLLNGYVVPRVGSVKLTDLTTHRLKALYAELAKSGRREPKALPDGQKREGLSPVTVRHVHRVVHLCPPRRCRGPQTLAQSRRRHPPRTGREGRNEEGR